MGLKTTNYTVKSTDYTYENAYAILSDLKIQNDWVDAVFTVQETREKALTKAPLETVHLRFKFVRNENPVETAYNLVKGKMIDYVLNEETGVHEPKEIEMPFYGWEDDRV